MQNEKPKTDLSEAERLRLDCASSVEEPISRRNERDSKLRPRTPLCPEGLKPLDFQIKAVRFALTRNRSYLALDPGLGKTIIAALIQNLTKATIFYVCPPFLLTNTDQEFEKWCFQKKLYLIPDSMIAKVKFHKKFLEAFNATEGDKILIVDEAHRFKTLSAERTKALYYDYVPHFKKSRIIFMSGTPMPNSRPMELWPVLFHLAPAIFNMNKFKFGLRYCGGYKTEWGWRFESFTNKLEFKKKITSKFMLRIKKEVLNLPPKLEGLLTVGDNIPPIVSDIEKKVLERYSPEDLVQGVVKENAGYDSEEEIHIATYLRLLGSFKLQYALPYIDSILEDPNENIIIYAVHKDVVKQLTEHLKEHNPIVITGEVHKDKRQDLVKSFQESKERRVFIGNIQACGVGFTLTKATRVIFVEFSWVDGDNSQAADRAHRIGQSKTVLVQYVVLKDSFDRKRMEVLLNKRKNSI